MFLVIFKIISPCPQLAPFALDVFNTYIKLLTHSLTYFLHFVQHDKHNTYWTNKDLVYLQPNAEFWRTILNQDFATKQDEIQNIYMLFVRSPVSAMVSLSFFFPHVEFFVEFFVDFFAEILVGT